MFALRLGLTLALPAILHHPQHGQDKATELAEWYDATMLAEPHQKPVLSDAPGCDRQAIPRHSPHPATGSDAPP